MAKMLASPEQSVRFLMIRFVMRCRLRLPLLISFALLVGFGCSSPPAAPSQTLSPPPALTDAQVITIGDIDADEPVKKVKRFTPLAKFLADNLSEYGIQEGKVQVARSIDEMGKFLKEGKVDIYFDSGFPTLAVQQLSGSEIILRRWKQQSHEYWSTYVVRKDSGITSVDGLVGNVLVFEEPYSTSGFILPAGTLIQRGFNLREVGSAEAEVRPDEIGYFFSQDEENTIELVLSGKVHAGGVSNQDYQGLPQELMDQLLRFDRTITVPRQLVSVRPGMDPGMVTKIQDLLAGLDQTEEERRMLEDLKKTSKFDSLPAESQASLGRLEELMELVTRE